MNYAFYDPELHWCKACNVFPKTAKDYLNHLHSKDHADVVKKATESPWHENNQNVVSYAKIMPIQHLIYRTSVAHVINKEQ